MTTQTNRNLEIANTIRDQIGHRAMIMMGARNLLAHDSALSFRIRRNARSINTIKITLDPCDTYTVEFLCVRGASCQTVASVSDVYTDCLHTVIEERTGLYLSL